MFRPANEWWNTSELPDVKRGRKSESAMCVRWVTELAPANLLPELTPVADASYFRSD